MTITMIIIRTCGDQDVNQCLYAASQHDFSHYECLINYEWNLDMYNSVHFFIR